MYGFLGLQLFLRLELLYQSDAVHYQVRRFSIQSLLHGVETICVYTVPNLISIEFGRRYVTPHRSNDLKFRREHVDKFVAQHPRGSKYHDLHRRSFSPEARDSCHDIAFNRSRLSGA